VRLGDLNARDRRLLSAVGFLGADLSRIGTASDKEESDTQCKPDPSKSSQVILTVILRSEATKNLSFAETWKFFASAVLGFRMIPQSPDS
jgi:hypothetical protein